MENKIEAAHYVVDFYQIENKSLNNEDFCLNTLHRAIEITGQKIVNIHQHKTDTEIIISAILSTGHCNISTWPERTYCAIDFYGCNNEDLKKGIDYLVNSFNPKKIRILELKRGYESDI